MSTAPVLGNRTCHRFQILNCRVQLKSKGIFGRFGKEIHHLSLIDLSATGIQAISSKVLNNKKEYDITILVPAFQAPISTKGRVVWHKPYTTSNQQHYFRVGLEFTYFKDQAIKRIEHLEFDPELRKIV